MVKSKIFYDSVVRTREEFEKYLVEFREGSNLRSIDSSLIENQYFDSLQSLYFAILNNSPNEIISKIKTQVSKKIGIDSIAEECILGSAKNCGVYRISISSQIEIYREDILNTPNAWIKMKDLHSKGPRAIANLIERIK